MKHHLDTQTYRITELVLLTIVLPALLYAVIPLRYMLPTLWLTALYCHLIYRAVVDAPQRIYWRWGEVNRANLRAMAIRFAISAAILTPLVLYYKPDMFLSFVRERPAFWALVMVLYPILSVIPQEIIFRSFFFTRYQRIFTSEQAMVLASGITFGAAHLIFQNWVAPALCLLGGLIFAQTYARTKSLALVWIEHSLYGCMIFTLGLGRYFYHGAVGPQ